MKTFQDYVTLKEVSGTTLARGLVGIDQTSGTSLSPKEILNINELLKLLVQVLQNNSAQTVISRIQSLLAPEDKKSSFDFNTAFLKSAAETLANSFQGSDRGLGDMPTDQIANNSADRDQSSY